MGAVLSWSWLMLKYIITNQKPPRLSQGILVGLEGLPTSGVHGLSLECFVCQRLLHRERGLAVGSLLLLLQGVSVKSEGVTMRNLAKYVKYVVFVVRRFWQVFGKFWKFGLAKIASFLLFRAVVRNDPYSLLLIDHL